MPNDLNYANALFGGRALEWIATQTEQEIRSLNIKK
jgi:acyl-CoA hydrolase